MTEPSVRAATLDEAGAVVALWQRCGLVVAHNDPHQDFLRALAGPASAVLVIDADAAIAGAVMVGHDGHRGWIYYLAVDPEKRRRGHARALVAAAEAWCVARRIRKLQLMVRPGNTVLPFYRAIGYEKTPRVVMARWLTG